MKKMFDIEVDCANCANLMEGAVNKTEGVASAVVNYMAQRITIEFTEGADVDAVMKQVIKNCKKIDDDFEIFV